MNVNLQCARSGQPIADFEIIDMHGHIGRYSFAIPDLSIEGMVRTMDRVGIRSIIVSHLRCLSMHCASGNREVYKAMQAFPGRILGYAAFWPESSETTEKEAIWCAEHGFSGLKLHNLCGFPYDGEEYTPAMRVANERRMPVLFHVWGGDEEFRHVATLAEKYPDASLILAHSGCNNTSGYIEMANKHDNVYLDIAFSRVPRGMVKRLVDGAGAQKVLFGSDAYFFSQAQQIGRIAGEDLDEEATRLVLGGNARRLLNRIHA